MSKIIQKEYTDFNDYLIDYYSLVSTFTNSYIKFISSEDSHRAERKEKSIWWLKEKSIIINNNAASRKITIKAEELKIKYNLKGEAWFCVIVAVLISISEKYRNLFSQVGGGQLNYRSVLKLYNFAEEYSDIPNLSEQLENLRNSLSPLGIQENDLKISDDLNETITLNQSSEGFSGVKTYSYEDMENNALAIKEELAKQIKNFILKNTFHKTVYFNMYGLEGSGRKTVAKRAAQFFEKDFLVIDLKEFVYNSENLNSQLTEVIYKNQKPNILLGIDNFDVLFEKDYEKQITPVINLMAQHFKIIFILSNKKIDKSMHKNKFCWIYIPFEDLSELESLTLWKTYMESIKDITSVSPESMANKFTFTPMQIKDTTEEAKNFYLWNEKKKLNQRQLNSCAYQQVISTLGDKARLITKKYTWDDIVLDSNVKLQLKRACDRIKYKHIVYNDWGMKKNFLYGRGLSMMFYGESGTGKTMAAQVISSELGLDLYKIDLARVISKYIGETEKNLKEIFDEAKKSNVILLFDEADSLFSKRTEVKDSHDRNANIETAFLLQQMEDYNGITILTTNKDTNIDDAFKRRITFKISFSIIHPGVPGNRRYEENIKLRRDLWNVYFKNNNLPLSEDIDFKYLIDSFEPSGAEISNIALTSAFLAASEGGNKIEFKHILHAVKNVLGKGDDDFGAYAYISKDCI